MLRAILIILTLSVGSLQADVTVRYSSAIKSSLPAMMQQAAGQLQSVLPPETSLRIKGNKSYAEYGATRSIGDSATKQMTLLDTAGKKYTVMDADQYLKSIADAVPKMPDAAAAIMASFKMNADSKLTGRTATVQGIAAEEREMVLSVEGPAMPNMPPGPMVRVVIQIWMSKESEADRIPALRELAAYNQSAFSAMNPATSLKKVFDMLPGMADKMGGIVKEMSKPNSVMVRMHFDLFMPFLAAAMKQMPAGASPLGTGADLDPNGSLMQMDQELMELSTAAVPDSQFQVPEQYTQQPADEFMKAYMARLMPAAK